MKRYGRLLLLVLAAALAVSVLARLPRPASRHEEPEPVPAFELAIEIGDSSVTPASVAVPKNHRILLRVHNQAAHPLSVRLAGYERQVSIAALPADSTWRGEFLSDLPGEDFAWLVDGQPVGRLSVSGSHLVEGHR